MASRPSCKHGTDQYNRLTLKIAQNLFCMRLCKRCCISFLPRNHAEDLAHQPHSLSATKPRAANVMIIDNLAQLTCSQGSRLPYLQTCNSATDADFEALCTRLQTKDPTNGHGHLKQLYTWVAANVLGDDMLERRSYKDGGSPCAAAMPAPSHTKFCSCAPSISLA